MARQHTPLVLVEPTSGCRVLAPVSLSKGTQSDGYDEAWLQDLIFRHPQALPVGELDPAYGPLIPICKEFDTRAVGSIDALFMNPLGMPTLVECSTVLQFRKAVKLPFQKNFSVGARSEGTVRASSRDRPSKTGRGRPRTSANDRWLALGRRRVST